MVERVLTPELKGVKTENNFEAEKLEKLLGIVFPVKPLKVSLSFSNIINLHRNFKIAHPQTPFLKEKSQFKNRYEPLLHAYFYMENKVHIQEILTNYHENIHGFTHSINPKMSRIHFEFLLHLAKGLNQKQSLSAEMLEKGIACGTFDEGMSEWSKYEAFFIENGRNLNFPTLSFQAHQLQLIDNEISTSMSVREKINELVKKNRTELSRLSNPNILKREVESLRTMKREKKEKLFYDLSGHLPIGHYFVNGALYELRKSGMTRAEAMVYLIKHPPSKIDQLAHPTEYAIKLLSKS